MEDNYQAIREAKLHSLEEIVDFIKINNQHRQFFDKNGNRDIYDQFKTNEDLRSFHTQVHYFLAQHLPTKNIPPPTVVKRVEIGSCLKKKTYDLNIQ